jgi:hypothetical protein
MRWTRIEDKVVPDFRRQRHRPNGDESLAVSVSKTSDSVRMFGDLGHLFEGLYDLSLRDPVLRVALRFLARTCWYLFDCYVRRPEGLLHDEIRLYSQTEELAFACHAPGALAFAQAVYQDFDCVRHRKQCFERALINVETIGRALGWYAGHGLMEVRDPKEPCIAARANMIHNVLSKERVVAWLNWDMYSTEISLAFSEGLLMAGQFHQTSFELYKLAMTESEYQIQFFVYWHLTKVVALQRLNEVLTWLDRMEFAKHSQAYLLSLLLATATSAEFDSLLSHVKQPQVVSYMDYPRLFHVGRTSVERACLTEKKLEYLRAAGNYFRVLPSPRLFELFQYASETTLEWLLYEDDRYSNHIVDFTAVIETTLVTMSRPVHIPPVSLAFTVRRVAFLLRWLGDRMAGRRVPGLLLVSATEVVLHTFSRLLGLLARCHESFESGASVDRNDVPAVLQLLLSLLEETRPTNPNSGRKGTRIALVEARHLTNATLGRMLAECSPWLRLVPYHATEAIWVDLATLLTDERLPPEVLTLFLNERPLASHPMHFAIAPSPEVVETFVHALAQQSEAMLQALLSWWKLNDYARLRTIGTWRRHMLLDAPPAMGSLIQAISRAFFDIHVTLEHELM